MSKRGDAYKSAGVDIEAANRFVGRIKDMVADTFTKGVLTGIGGFGGLFKPDLSQMTEPVLVAGADGVGTKLKLAFAFDHHDTIGIDLVAMSVNDVLVQGAKPLFFLDYFATGKLDEGVAEAVVSGIAQGCKEAGCALLGGETAEMPGFYAQGEYDLSGFCVGLVDNRAIVDGSAVTLGDTVIGLSADGPHSNGYSLIRKLFDQSGATADDILPGSRETFAQELLRPTSIYVKPVLSVLRDIEVKGMVHITGGGFYDNLPRILPRTVGIRLDFGSWDIGPVFHWLKKEGELSWPDMLQIFNCGLGYLLVVDKRLADDAIQRLQAMGVQAQVVGYTVKLEDGQEPVIFDF